MTPGISIPGHITALYLFAVINLLALFHVSLAEIVVTESVNRTIRIAEFYDLPASFGPSFPSPSEPLSGYVVYANPPTACDRVDPPPHNRTGSLKWILVARRNECSFDMKVANAEKAGYGAVIVHNVGSNYLLTMGRQGEEPIHIPSCFVGEHDGIQLATYFDYTTGRVVSIDNSIPFNPNYYLLPFAIVVGVCFILMVVFMIAKWLRDLRKKRRSRLSKSHLKKVPIKKFKKGDDYDVCAICLDDYEEGDKLRVLPCSHAYHVKCVDPWLLNNKRTCPVCKRKVIPGHDHDSDSSSEEDNNERDHSEVTPLLHGSGGPGRTRGSTFENSGLPVYDGPIINTMEYSDSDDSEDGPEDDMYSTGSSPSPHHHNRKSPVPSTSGIHDSGSPTNVRPEIPVAAQAEPVVEETVVHVLVNQSVNADRDSDADLSDKLV